MVEPGIAYGIILLSVALALIVTAQVLANRRERRQEKADREKVDAGQQ